MDTDDKKWVLEFSRIARMSGMYPFHIDLPTHAGRPPHHWRVIFVGTFEQVCAKHIELAKKIGVYEP